MPRFSYQMICQHNKLLICCFSHTQWIVCVCQKHVPYVILFIARSALAFANKKLDIGKWIHRVHKYSKLARKFYAADVRYCLFSFYSLRLRHWRYLNGRACFINRCYQIIIRKIPMANIFALMANHRGSKTRIQWLNTISFVFHHHIIVSSVVKCPNANKSKPNYIVQRSEGFVFTIMTHEYTT